MRRRLRRPSTALLVVLALTVTLVAPATAEPSSDQLRAEAARAQERLDELEETLSLAVETYLVAEEEAQAIADDITTIEAELRVLGADLETLSAAAGDHVRRMYMAGPTVELTSVFIGGDINDAGARAALLRRVLDAQQVDLDALSATRTTVQTLEADLSDRYAVAADLRDQLQANREQVEVTLASQEEEIEELQAAIQVALAREEEERRREEERLRREAEERARQQAAAEAARREAARREAAASTPSPRPSPSPPPPAQEETTTVVAAPAPRASAQVAVDTALAQLGKPYRWAGSGPNSFDCSGLTSFAWRAAGVSIPRSSRAQYGATTRVSRADLRPGDLVFYHSPISHVAMYIGGGRVVEAPNSGNVVRIRNDGLTRRGVVGYGRVG